MQGGARPRAGRKRGVPNKVTVEIRAIARLHGEAAVKELVRLMTKSKSEMARIAAAKEILDRGYVKATQPLSGDPDQPSAFPDKIEIVVVKPTVDTASGDAGGMDLSAETRDRSRRRRGSCRELPDTIRLLNRSLYCPTSGK